MTPAPKSEPPALGFMTTRELLVHRRLAQRALRRRRTPDQATAMLARIEAELARRRDGRMARAAAKVPPLYPGWDKDAL